MKITTKSTAGISVIVLIIVCMHFFSIVKLPIPSAVISEISWVLAFLIYIYTFKGRCRIHPKYPYIGRYFAYIVIAQIVLCIYSMIKYNETVYDMLLCVGAYSILSITYAILISFEKDGMQFLMDAVFWLVFISICLAIVHALIYNFTGIKLLGFDEIASKNVNIRISLGALMGVFFVYTFYNILQKRKRCLMTIALLLGVFAVFYVEMTRAKEVAVLGTLFIMWAFKKQNSKKDIVKYLIILMVLIVFLYSGLFESVLNTFSINPNINDQYQSTEARYNAIEYFSTFTDNNPLFGMGWVRPYTDELTKIFSGPTRTSFFDDLGFLGQFYRQGLLGVGIYLALILRMIYITFRIGKKRSEKVFCAGLTSYVLFSTVSLNCFDAQRMLAVPFYIACTEYIYYRDKTRSTIVKTVGKRIEKKGIEDEERNTNIS